MNYKGILLSITLMGLLLSDLMSQPAWHFQDSPLAEDLISVSFVDTSYGWAASEAGKVIRTADGGQVWELVAGLNGFHPRKIFFQNRDTGWMVGSYTTYMDTSFVMRSLDGGLSWHRRYFRIACKINDIFFVNDSVGYIVGFDGDTLCLRSKTNSAGMWWTDLVGPGIFEMLYSVHFRDTLNGVMCGSGPTFMQTTSGGISPPGVGLSIFNFEEDMYDLVNAGTLYGCMVGANGKIWVTKDNWGSYLDHDYAGGDTLRSVDALEPSSFYVVGDGGTILQANYSQFFGLTVQDHSLDIDTNLLEVDVIDGEHIWAVGNDGAIVKYGYEIIPPEPVVSPFTPVFANFDSLAFGNAIWGDIDHDMDYDIIVCGERSDGQRITSIYYSQDGVFSDSHTDLEGVMPLNDRSMAFTDLNRNEYIDLIITGRNNNDLPVTKLYINDREGGFTEYTTDLPGVHEGSVDWGDYDNDGDPDLLITGELQDGSPISEIYRNEGTVEDEESWTFVPINSHFWPLEESTAKFVDLNGDDYLDVLASGMNENNEMTGYYYLNSEGSYVAGFLEGGSNGSLAWCDYDGDGKLEILSTGDTSYAGFYPATRLMRYGMDGFTEITINLENVFASSADWGDYDGDGDYDLILTGMNRQLEETTILYENDQNELIHTGYEFPGIAEGTARWGDYDNDGDLDLLLSGYTDASPERLTVVYRNDSNFINQAPAPPASFNVDIVGKRISVSWEEATDAETPANSLTYNVRLKPRKSRRDWVVSPPAGDEGIDYITKFGNAQNNSFIINDLDSGVLYTCEVQTLDAGYAGSAWTGVDFNAPGGYFKENGFTINADHTIQAEWIDFDGEEGLELFLAGVNSFPGAAFSRIYHVVEGELDTAIYTDLGHDISVHRTAVMDLNNDNVLDFSYGYDHDSLFTIYLTGYGDTTLKTDIYTGGFDWGDYDSDGDEDLIMFGIGHNQNVHSRLYRNQNGRMEKVDILLPGTYAGDVRWIDFDNDEDKDLAVTGSHIGEPLEGFIPDTRIYENVEGVMIDTKMEFEKMHWSGMDFGDFDNDGDPDLLICGLTDEEEAKTLIYRNDSGIYHLTDHQLTGIYQGACRWVDLNHDQQLDIVLTGRDSVDLYYNYNSFILKVYFREDSTFREVLSRKGFGSDTDGTNDAFIAAGDYNGDDRTDLLIGGTETSMNCNAILYENLYYFPNFKPLSPRMKSAISHGDSIRFRWKEGEDQLVGVSSGLTYNLRVGTTPGGTDIISPKSWENGVRKVVAPGNLGSNLGVTIKGLIPGQDYYFAVQSVDASFAGSSFSGELRVNSTTGGFILQDSSFRDVRHIHSEWMDTDNDQDLDLLVTRQEGNDMTAGIYLNEEGEIDTQLVVVHQENAFGELLMQDFNNDNLPDFSLSETDAVSHVTIYKNVGGTYQAHEVKLDGLGLAKSVWGDFHSDGMQDFVQVGVLPDSSLDAIFYRNSHGSFENLANPFTGMIGGSIKVVDIDTDGDLDVFACGLTGSVDQGTGDLEAILYRNVRGAFGLEVLPLPGLIYSDVDFGDYDNDGDPDMLYCGSAGPGSTNKTYILNNEEGNLVLADSLVRASGGECRFVDLDGDGLLDIVLSGEDADLPEGTAEDLLTYVYLNVNHRFIKAAELKGIHHPTLAIGDYTGNENPDLFIGGDPLGNGPGAYLYENIYRQLNNTDARVVDLHAEPSASSILFTWSIGSHSDYSKIGIGGNLRVGTSPGACDILSPLAHDIGTRKVTGPGNAGYSGTYQLNGLAPGTTYYYAAQGLNKAGRGSYFTVEQSVSTLSTGTGELVSTPSFLLFPNPTTGTVTVRFHGDLRDPVRMDLFNQAGQLVLSSRKHLQGAKEVSFNVPDRGIYTLRLIIGKEVMTRMITRL